MTWPVSTQGGEVNSVGVSGGGEVIIAGTCIFNPLAPGTPTPALGTYAYDASGKELWKDVATPPPGDIGVYWVAVSRDGQWAASGGGNHKVPPKGPLGLGYLTAYHVPTANGAPQRLLNANIGGVNAVALSGDGSYLVAGADAAYVFARTGLTFGAPLALKDGLTATDNVVAVAISEDGQRVVYGTTAHQVVLYAPALCANITWQAPQNHIVKWVAMAADGSGFAAVTTNAPFAKAKPAPYECNAYFFSLASGSTSFVTTQQPMFTWPLAGCTGTLSVAISADGSRVAAVANVPKVPAGTAGKVFFFDAQSNAQRWVGDTSEGPNSVSMDDAGKWIAVADGFGAGSPGHFYLFDAYGTPMALPSQPATISWTIQIAADGTALAAGTDDGKIFDFEMVPVAAAPTNQRTLPEVSALL